MLSHVQLFATPWTVDYEATGKSTGVGCHFLLQGISPTQGTNLGLLYCRWILNQLSHQGRLKNSGQGGKQDRQAGTKSYGLCKPE